VFSTRNDGDLRASRPNRAVFSGRLGITSRWATVRQVHEASVIEARTPGLLGDADGLYTRRAGLPLAVFTADCVPVVLEAPEAVGVAHAGWRGLVRGVVAAVHQAMTAAGTPPVRAAIGPSIGPCCYEVGDDVLEQLGDFASSTTWGTPSVDLWAAATDQLNGLPATRAGECTMHTGAFSHRREGTEDRMAAVVWVP
jgi:YfiH family protein